VPIQPSSFGWRRRIKTSRFLFARADVLLQNPQHRSFVMPRKWLQSLLMVLLAAAVLAASADTGYAFLHGHRRYPAGNSPTWPNATSPHGGFSSSNGYYSGRSRIVDAPVTPVPVTPIPVTPVPAK